MTHLTQLTKWVVCNAYGKIFVILIFVVGVQGSKFGAKPFSIYN